MKIDKTAISFYEDYCDGYGAPGSTGNGYVSVLKVSVGTVPKTDDILIDGIV
ncbi:MAG: histidine decarboxylase, pyruvoyl type, partial [Cetobacterium somerae]